MLERLMGLLERAVVALERLATAAPAAYGPCPLCGQTVTAENGSRSQDGKVTHTSGCPKRQAAASTPLVAAVQAVAEQPKPAEQAKPADGPSLDDVRRALQGYARVNGSEKAVDLLKRHGAQTASALEKSKYAAIIADCALAAAAKAEEPPF